MSRERDPRGYADCGCTCVECVTLRAERIAKAHEIFRIKSRCRLLPPIDEAYSEPPRHVWLAASPHAPTPNALVRASVV